MHRVQRAICTFIFDQRGQSLGEYALILLLIALAAIAGVILFGAQLAALYNQIVAGFP
ncbi:MAG TPA: Flp family type IVb pilin [bacterium]|nr:Flp family type IVb pilin [bacterium]HQI48295.1 Flp family type IVb pilin [bacterium]HQJ64911.1 Flp family type IVb pilin [bacterium]